MTVLLIGGAGGLGLGVLSHLASRQPIRVLDIVAVPESYRSPEVGMIIGDVGDPTTVAAACAGVSAVIHLAAVIPFASYTPAQTADAYAVNVASVHTSLVAAAEAGASSFVNVSTMSVYRDYMHRPVDPTAPGDATDVYGLTKRFGEEVCAALAGTVGASHDMTVSSARLAFPTPDDAWPRWVLPHGRPNSQPRLDDGTPLPALAMSDVAAALEAAVAYRGPYRTFSITADVSGVSMTRDDGTYGVLGWQPLRVTSSLPAPPPGASLPESQSGASAPPIPPGAFPPPAPPGAPASATPPATFPPPT